MLGVKQGTSGGAPAPLRLTGRTRGLGSAPARGGRVPDATQVEESDDGMGAAFDALGLSDGEHDEENAFQVKKEDDREQAERSRLPQAAENARTGRGTTPAHDAGAQGRAVPGLRATQGRGRGRHPAPGTAHDEAGNTRGAATANGSEATTRAFEEDLSETDDSLSSLGDAEPAGGTTQLTQDFSSGPLRLKEMPMHSPQFFRKKHREQRQTPLPLFRPSAMVLPQLSKMQIEEYAPFALSLGGVWGGGRWVHYATPKTLALAQIGDLPVLLMGEGVSFKSVMIYALQDEEEIPVVVSLILQPTREQKAFLQGLLDVGIVHDYAYETLLPPDLVAFLRNTLEGKPLLIQPVTNDHDPSAFKVTLGPVETFMIQRVSVLDPEWKVDTASLYEKVLRIPRWTEPAVLLHRLPEHLAPPKKDFDSSSCPTDTWLLYGRPFDKEAIRGLHTFSFKFDDEGEEVEVEVTFLVKALGQRCEVVDCGDNRSHATKLHQLWMDELREKWLQLFQTHG